ncbi:MAG: N-6 DNA methylase [Chloroflexi bacterium]|nr:N-6 DNA methylase [Chloroflexota bacterium]
MKTAEPRDALTHYANICRKEIQELFPRGDDGTTIINGTIFVNEQGAPNFAQAGLFCEILEHLQQYDSEFGSFKYIRREFKTRLYESFLRQNPGIKFLGQYFTPRNVVRAMVAMSGVRHLRAGARVCDPFCGVGGFLLELIAENESIQQQFTPKDGKVKPRITLVGYDKGSDEKDDERTIILAKANMLIYFSDLLALYRTRENLEAFAIGGLNQVFHLLRSNLGTFGVVDDEPDDLILTNPPYVTSGSASLRRAITENSLDAHYTFGGRGTEALAAEWVVRNLRDGGEGLLVVPDGLLRQTEVLRALKRYCLIRGIVSLPLRTFYSTPKKTYILSIMNKDRIDQLQEDPVFAYVASEIGETRDADRFATEQNDLVDMTDSFNQFKGAPAAFKASSARCKTIPYATFDQMTTWMVDRECWSDAERADLGVVEADPVMSIGEYADEAVRLSELASDLSTYAESVADGDDTSVEPLTLGDESYFGFITGKTGWTRAVLRELDTHNEDHTPVYTAAADPVAFVIEQSPKLIQASPEARLLSFASNGDGSAGRNFVIHDRPFYVSNDRTVIKIASPDIVPEFLWYGLQSMKREYGFDHAYKATPRNLQDVTVYVPVTPDGALDPERQLEIARKFMKLTDLRRQFRDQSDLLTSSRVTLD